MDRYKLAFFLLPISFFSCTTDNKPIVNNNPVNEVSKISYTVINRFPHDTSSFTEGFLFHNNQLFESTGSPDNLPQTKSVFGIVNLQTGIIEEKVELDRSIYFGEGIVFLKDKIFQLTYKNQICFVYNAKTFKRVWQFTFKNKEGWGLTTDGKHIIMSDGTNILTYLNPDDFKIVKTLAISENNYAANYLNELEFIKGFIYANIWTTNKIVKIDPSSGKVIGELDLTPLKVEASFRNPKSFEMNGIAYDSLSDKVYVTGKMWADIYQIDLSH